MSIKIEVKSTEVHTKSGTAAATGKPYSIREQDAWAFTTDREGNPQEYPQAIRITLDDQQQPYPVGFHTIAPTSFYVGQWGQLMCRIRLKPLGAQTAAKAS